jgi:broad specificity polyphosphatase/5'/3'-nucleotidase SurE
MTNSSLNKIEEIANELEKRAKEMKEMSVVTGHMESISKSMSVSTDTIKLESKKLSDFIEDSSENINKVERSVEKIDNVNFPSRIDKIDSSVSAVYQGIQNLQMRVENFERSIKETIEKENKEIHLKLNNSQKIVSYILIVEVVGFLVLMFKLYK